jgi:hypothetical protein
MRIVKLSLENKLINKLEVRHFRENMSFWLFLLIFNFIFNKKKKIEGILN